MPRSRRRGAVPDAPTERRPSLSPGPGECPKNDEAWLRFFLTAPNSELRRLEYAIKGSE